jgi:hypothetical protein
VSAAQELAALLAARRPEIARTWRADAFDAAFAAAGRRLGTELVGGETRMADTHRWSIATWGLDEVGRAVLLLDAVARVPFDDHLAWLDGHYRAGALRERQAIVRALALLPEPARFLPIALDACRTSTQPVFEAIACENPYPAAYFPEPSFNHMVLKAVFTEVPLIRILDLATRLTNELARMAADYASERAAAGRSIPADLGLLTRGSAPT